MAISFTLVDRQTHRGYIANDFWANHAWCQSWLRLKAQFSLLNDGF